MFERFFTGHRLLTYLHLRDRVATPILFAVAFAMVGGPILALVLWRLEILSDFKAIGYHRADVLYSTIRESEHSRTLYMRSKTNSGQEFLVISKDRSLYALAGQEVCLKVFENQADSTQRASLVAFGKCATLPET